MTTVRELRERLLDFDDSLEVYYEWEGKKIPLTLDSLWKGDIRKKVPAEDAFTMKWMKTEVLILYAED